jgi:hypothetical protein
VEAALELAAELTGVAAMELMVVPQLF